MEPLLRLGFVGAGRMGQQAHLACYSNLPQVACVVLAEGRGELARRVADRYGMAETCPSHRDLLGRDDLDGVVVVVPFQHNHAIVSDLLGAGLAVASEKAVASTEPAAAALVAAAAAAGRPYQVSYMKRFDPGVAWAAQTIAALLASGELGELHHARVWCCEPGDWTWHSEPPLTTDEPPADYGLTPEPAQPGASREDLRWAHFWLNYYSHQTNLLRYLLGERYEPVWYDRWDGGNLVEVRTASGRRGCVEAVRFRSRGWDEGFEVRFADGVLRGRLPSPLDRGGIAQVELERADGKASIHRPWLPPVWAMRRQAEAFVALLRGQGPELSPASDAADDVRLAWQLAAWQRGEQ